MIERNQPADNRLLPNREPYTVTVLQSECRLFIRKPEFLRLWPQRRNFARSAAGTHEGNCRIQIFATAFVSVNHCVRCVTDREAAVVARAIAHIGMKNVVV